MTHIAIKIEEATQRYIFTKGNTRKEAKVDTNTGAKHWQHPTDTIKRILEENDERSQIQIYTDGRKSEEWLGAVIAIFKSGHHIKSLHCRLNNRCTKYQAKQLAILS